jgi:hypothetical protein
MDNDDDIDAGSAVCDTLAAVQAGTAIASDLATTLPADALSAIGELTSTLGGVIDAGLSAALGPAIAALGSAEASLEGAASALTGQITNQLSNLTNNIQIFSAFNDLNTSTCPGVAQNIAANVDTFFGSMTLTAAIASIIARRLDRISTGEDITADTVPTINDECAQIESYATQLATQSTTEPAALADATTALTQMAEANVLVHFLNVPEVLPILAIVAGPGFSPVVDTFLSTSAINLGYADTTVNYSNVAVAPNEVPQHANIADPVPPPS